jgi:hypothetical protein
MNLLREEIEVDDLRSLKTKSKVENNQKPFTNNDNQDVGTFEFPFWASRSFLVLRNLAYRSLY